MEAKTSYSVSEVVELSGKSQSTVSRAVTSGALVPVRGSNPLALEADSVHKYLRKLIEKGPRLPDGVPERSTAEVSLTIDDDPTSERRIAQLELAVSALESTAKGMETENERFRNTILVLRQNYAALSDDLGSYTGPRIPNR